MNLSGAEVSICFRSQVLPRSFYKFSLHIITSVIGNLRHNIPHLTSSRQIMGSPHNRFGGADQGFVRVTMFLMLFGCIRATQPLHSSFVKRALGEGIQETTDLILSQPKEIQPISGQVTSLVNFMEQSGLTKHAGFIAFVDKSSPNEAKRGSHETKDIAHGTTKTSLTAKTSLYGTESGSHENRKYYMADLYRAQYRFLKEKFPEELGRFFLKAGEIKFAENEIKKHGTPERTLQSFWHSRVRNPEEDELEGEDKLQEFVGWLQRKKSYWSNEKMSIDQSNEFYNLQKLYEGVLEWLYERGPPSTWSSDRKDSLALDAKKLVELDLYPLLTQSYSHDPGLPLQNFKEVTSQTFSHTPDDMKSFTQWLRRKHHEGVNIDDKESYSLECLIVNYISWIDEEYKENGSSHFVAKGIKDFGQENLFHELVGYYGTPDELDLSIIEVLETETEIDLLRSMQNKPHDGQLDSDVQSVIKAKWERFTEKNVSRKRSRTSAF